MTSIDKALADLDFPKAEQVQGRASIADLFRAGQRCGIYVLHCTNQQYYIGQAVDVTRRYVQHLINHPDIERISFKQVIQTRLTEEERRIIHSLETDGFILRNIRETSYPTFATDFDSLMPLDEQTSWLTDPSYIDLSGTRLSNPGHRLKYTQKYLKLKTMPFVSEMIDVQRKYVLIGIPIPLQTEMSFWNCSCLPSFSTSKGNLFSRINIYSQEVFTIGISDNKPFFSWHLSKSPLEKLATRMKLRWKYHIRADGHQYKPGGQDQINISIDGSIANALNFLDDKEVILAIRRFNLGLMRKGPNLNSRSHCLDLADRLLE